MTTVATEINAPISRANSVPRPMSRQGDKRQVLTLCLSLAIAIAATYWPALRSELVGIAFLSS